MDITHNVVSALMLSLANKTNAIDVKYLYTVYAYI